MNQVIDLRQKCFLSGEGLKTLLRFRFFGAAVICIGDGAVFSFVMLDMFFSGDNIVTLTAPNETSKRKIVWLFGVGVASFLNYPLHPIKKFLGNNWLVDPFVYLSGVAKEADIKWVGEDKFDLIPVNDFSLFVIPTNCGPDSIFRQKVRYILQGVNTSGIQFESFFDNGGFLLINNDGFVSDIVEIANWSQCWVFSPPHFLA